MPTISKNNNSSFSRTISIPEEEATSTLEVTIVERYNIKPTVMSGTIDGSYQLHYACTSSQPPAGQQ